LKTTNNKRGELVSPQFKEKKMRIDFNQALRNFAGQTLKEPDPNAKPKKDENGKEVPVLKEITLRDIALGALTATHEDERGLKGEDKAKRYHLAEKIYASKKEDGVVHVEAKDVDLIKELIGKSFPVIAVGQAYELLDPMHEGNSEDDEPKKTKPALKIPGKRRKK
jgi:hypothetical protein